ncbi:MAG: CinA family nicotinamide mononucleotide deamidase-related protein [Holophagaceae bacterium]|nr:CinA family nicotinamide mononucleotide deamidase-related protein [Holophagaceae bacterium]
MLIEIIAIGSELLNAGRVDTNSIWIAERLGELGLELTLKTCVGDDTATLKACIVNALERADIIITTGGLGPTFDDQTKESFAEIIGVPMFKDDQVRAKIDNFFQAGRVVTENNYKQALIPKGAEAIHNPLGTAPGIYWTNLPSHPKCKIIMLPGVPKEMMAIWEGEIHSRLKGLAGQSNKTMRFVVGGRGESLLDEKTLPIRELHSHLQWTILAPKTHVEFLVRSKSEKDLQSVRKDMENALGDDLICVGSGQPETILLDMLVERGETVALAESVSGGILASRLASQPGASRAFAGGVVAYTPIAKTMLVGVATDFIDTHGTVGNAITIEMAERIRKKMETTWGIAITGNAGPSIDPNSSSQNGANQIGRCYIAVAGRSGTTCQSRDIHGDRADIQLRATNWAIDMLRRLL